ncbi:MFS general substrate transporter [Agrocybe pediades]|nr:MFS general substrate transporter [Agrocybe pediades]
MQEEKLTGTLSDEKSGSLRSASTDDGYLLAPDQRQAAEKRLVRKLDQRVLPTIVAIYIMNYIDRTAVAAARLKGLEKDLHLTEIQYNVVLAILFVAYCPAQIPSNMVRKIPSIYIGLCAVLWGLTSLLAGITKNFAGIVACRIFIGFPEAAFYPGSIYLLSRWYTRKELALRSAILYTGFITSNAFGSLMAAGILSGMEGKLGIRAWRWLFYIEGAITIFIGLNAMWLLSDYPHNTRWLSVAERRLACARIAGDAGEADEDSESDTPLQGLKLALQDPKVYIFALMNCAQLLGIGYINFFPTLTATLGFSTTITLLIAAPPWIVAALICVLNARHADKTGERFWHVTFWWWMNILGYVIAQSTMSIGGRYVSLFFLAVGNVGFSMTLVWVSNSIPRPPSKRAASIGIVNGFGNIGNLISSFVWKVEWAPKYTPSMVIGISAFVLAISLALAMRFMLIRENRMLDEDVQGGLKMARKERIEKAAQLEGTTVEEAMEKKREFRYLY